MTAVLGETIETIRTTYHDLFDSVRTAKTPRSMAPAGFLMLSILKGRPMVVSQNQVFDSTSLLALASGAERDAFVEIVRRRGINLRLHRAETLEEAFRRALDRPDFVFSAWPEIERGKVSRDDLRRELDRADAVDLPRDLTRRVAAIKKLSAEFDKVGSARTVTHDGSMFRYLKRLQGLVTESDPRHRNPGLVSYLNYIIDEGEAWGERWRKGDMGGPIAFGTPPDSTPAPSPEPDRSTLYRLARQYPHKRRGRGELEVAQGVIDICYNAAVARSLDAGHAILSDEYPETLAFLHPAAEALGGTPNVLAEVQRLPNLHRVTPADVVEMLEIHDDEKRGDAIRSRIAERATETGLVVEIIQAHLRHFGLGVVMFATGIEALTNPAGSRLSLDPFWTPASLIGDALADYLLAHRQIRREGAYISRHFGQGIDNLG